MTQAIALSRPRGHRAAAAFLTALALLAASAPAVRALGRLVPVIVMGRDAGEAAALTTAADGDVVAPLPIVHGVSARVPASRLAELSARAVVVPDRPMRLQGADYGAGGASAYPAEVGAPALWEQGVTGAGVTVALVDTGIADVADLHGRVVAMANVTREHGFEDTYGHGTFQAGLIAGNGTSSAGRYTGVAPEAGLMSVKVAGADGSTSLGQVLAGIQLVDWSAARFGVRVALVAVSSGSPLPPDLDPLSLALRTLWAHGVAVVVPGGNDGPDAGTVTSPGEDPVLLTAGSVDDRATGDVADDVASEFSGRGPTRWGDPKPDVAAPGEHLVSLRAPGSTIDVENPSARVEDVYFKGSGTSMSAAVTAGAAALVLQAHPELSPDAVKAVLQGTATSFDGADATAVGAGVVDAASAVAQDTSGLSDLPSAREVDDPAPPFSPRGLDFSWFDQEDGPALWLARRWMARGWNGRTWSDEEWAARSWAQREWAARSWAARSWAARSWAARSWAARSWAARSWAVDTWDARSWNARSWAARSWNARSWAARSWNARTWNDQEWDARSWSARTWSARTWSARTWSARTWS